MNVLFVYPVPPPKFQILRYQQGIGSISAVLKQAGHRTQLLILSHFDAGALRAAIRRYRPGLVALSVTSGFWEMGRDIACWIKRNDGPPVLLGGVHPTMCPEESIAAEGVFAICRGEGEYPTLELCEALEGGGDPTRIKNLWVKRNGTICRNELRPLIRDLDALPYPDREIFGFEEMLEEFPEAEFMGSRGCPYLCAYCVNHGLMKLYRGKGAFVRHRSVDNLLGEIAAVTETYPKILHLGFHDDTFTLNLRWLREFAEKYPARFRRLPFWCNSTARLVNEETVKLLKAAGCYEVRIGIESGNDYLRAGVLRKKVTRDDVLRAFRLLREAGIRTYAFNMIGLPYETPQTINDTIRLNQAAAPDETFCSIFQPYPGTALYDLCRERRWFKGKAVGSYFENEYTLEQPSVTGREVVHFHDIFRDLVRWPRWDPLIRAMAAIPVTRTKSLYNVWRRVRAKCIELAMGIAGWLTSAGARPS